MELPWWVVPVLMVIEAWLGRTPRTQAGSMIELVFNAIKAIVLKKR